MNTADLERYISTDPSIKPFFLEGYYQQTHFQPHVISTPMIYIVNMQDSNQPGYHWIVIWIDTIPEYVNSLAE